MGAILTLPWAVFFICRNRQTADSKLPYDVYTNTFQKDAQTNA